MGNGKQLAARLGELEGRLALVEDALQSVLDDGGEFEAEWDLQFTGAPPPSEPTNARWAKFMQEVRPLEGGTIVQVRIPGLPKFDDEFLLRDLREAYGDMPPPPSVPRPPTVGDDYHFFLRISGFNDHPCLWRAFLAGRMTG